MVTLVVAIVIGVPVVLLLVIWLSHGMLKAGSQGPSSGTNAFGGFNVFEPARERAEQDLESKKLEVTLAPTPDDDDRPVRVDLQTNVVRIKLPETTQKPAPSPEP